MKNILFIGGSSELAIKLKGNLKKYNFFNLSRKKIHIYKKNNLIIKNYSSSELNKKINNINKKFSSVVIFNGIYVPSTFALFNENLFKKALKINLILPLKITKCLINSDLLEENSSINFVSSTAGIYPEIGNAYYAVSKAALIFSSKVLSKELKRNKIRVNAISLGMINNKMSRKMIRNLPLTKKNLFLKKPKNTFLSTKKIIKKFKLIIENKRISGKNIVLNN